jgi:hypothetical protein
MESYSHWRTSVAGDARAKSSTGRFYCRLIDINGMAVCEAARKQRANLPNPPKSVDQLLEGFERIGLVKTVEFFRRRRELL